MALSPVNPCVLFGECVTSFAFRNCWPRGIPPDHVFLICYRLKVERVHAISNSAQVIELKAFRYWPDVNLVAVPMSKNVYPCIDAKPSIAALVYVAAP